MLVDSAVYVDGHRTTRVTLKDAYRGGHEPGNFAWITLYDPTEEELVSAAGELGLDGLAVEDATAAHQRPRLERYGDCFIVLLKTARYVEGEERVEYGEIRAFLERDFVVTVCYGEHKLLSSIREEMEGEADRLRQGPAAILYEVARRVVEGYAPVVESLENDMDEIEAEVYGGNAVVSRRIHELSREVVRFHQATKPLAGGLDRLLQSGVTGDLGSEATKYLRRLRDRVLRVTEQIEGLRDLLSSILDVNLTMVGIRQNDQMQKISAWGAILVVPTLIAGVYGMNIPIPYADSFGHTIFVVGLLVVIPILLYFHFKRSGWL